MRCGSLLGPKFVGIDPGGLRRLADVADQYGERLSLTIAAAAPMLAMVSSLQQAIAVELGVVRCSLAESADDLRWRAGVVALAQSTGLTAVGPLGLDRWLAEFVSVGLFSPSTRSEDFTAWVGVRWLRELQDCEPEEVAAAFAAIGPDRARQLVTDHPQLVGRLDGAPPAARFAANRILIAAEIARLDQAAAKLRPLTTTGSPTGVVLRRLVERAAEYRCWLVEGRQILLFDPEGDGRAVEVFGDIDTAAAIGVLVPGMANDLGNFSTPAGGFRQDAASLFAAGAGDGVATIAWLGYDTPDGVDAAVRTAAEEAAPALARFVRGVDPHGERTITVFAHSYGSVVAGLAARSGLDADNLVFLGSPGTTLDSAGDAALRDGAQVWAALAPGDPIGLGIDPGASHRWWYGIHPLLPIIAFSSSLVRRDELWHGANPAGDNFGAIRIDTAGSTGHGEYYEASTLNNLSLILTGRHDEVARGN